MRTDYADFTNPRPTADDLYSARRNARLSRAEAAALCGLHRTSYARQESGQTRVNPAAYRLIQCYAGWLPDPAFDGWSVAQGKLWSPEDMAFTPGELRSIPWLYAQIAELKKQLRELEGKTHLEVSVKRFGNGQV